jgi:L-alanine-DL-glutamate epimerase-like enolase superfamily enzyme
MLFGGALASVRSAFGNAGAIEDNSLRHSQGHATWRDMVFVEVHTDAGLIGLGEATLETRADMVESGLRWLESAFVGKDPSGIEEHWRTATTACLAGGTGQ